MDQRYKEKHVRGKRWKARRKKTRIWSQRAGDCVVYCLTNRINGRMYIGYTTQSVFDRWGNGGSGYKGKCPAVWGAIEKYSWDNFEKRILVDGLNEDMAKEIEVFTIAFLKSRGNNLYNLTDGGDGAASGDMNPMKRPEVREARSEAMKEYYENHPEAREAMKGENNPMKRPEVREARSEAIKEYWENNPEAREAAREAKRDKMRPVEAIDPETGERVHYFESTHAAERAGFNKRHVSACCNGKRKTHHGYIWRWAKNE